VDNDSEAQYVITRVKRAILISMRIRRIYSTTSANTSTSYSSTHTRSRSPTTTTVEHKIKSGSCATQIEHNFQFLATLK
jgi:hypothetical protein